MSCWDTSALLKLYLQEADSAAFRPLAAASNRITISAIARFEAEAVFRRKRPTALFRLAKRMRSRDRSTPTRIRAR